MSIEAQIIQQGKRNAEIVDKEVDRLVAENFNDLQDKIDRLEKALRSIEALYTSRSGSYCVYQFEEGDYSEYIDINDVKEIIGHTKSKGNR